MSKGRKAKDLTDSTFGKLTVIKRAETGGPHAMWHCECDCGRKSVVRGSHLLQGLISSCGECKRTKASNAGIFAMGSLSSTRLKAGEDPYQNLANAIVAVAADDYRTALKNGDKELQTSLEEFFYSDLYEILTNVDADVILGALRKEHSGTLSTVNI